MMIDVQEKKNKIVSFLESNGPSLPVRIAKVIEMEPVFASAILSELLNEKRVKMSNLKVGSSSLYLLQGQEKKLEEHTDNLKPIEKEASLKLKEREILEDEKEEPVIRVALRNLKDFAIPFYQSDKLFWKYAFPDEKKPKDTPKKTEEKPEKENILSETKEKKPKEDVKEKLENIFERGKSDFFDEVKNFLNKKEIELLEEIQENKKEVVGKVNVKTSVGDVKFLLIAKNKKSVNKDEINAASQRASYYKMPCLILTKKPVSNAIQNYIKENNLLKIYSIEQP